MFADLTCSVLLQHQQLLGILGQAFFLLEKPLWDYTIHQTFWGVVGQVMQISWLIRYIISTRHSVQ
jgi:hypothetical protein